MANTQVATSIVHIPTFIPLAEAAQRYNLSEKALTQLIQTGKIEAIQLSSGELLVAAESNNGHKTKTKQEIITEEFSHLCGNTISASEASRKYSKIYGVTISNELFSRWSRLGYIKRVSGYRLSLDEADVAYCSKIFVEKYHEYGGRLQGVPIFDENGNPYHLKYREVAAQLRAERQTTNKKKRSAEGQNSY